MIVKNESKVIEECLDSVHQFIDTWVICDTGSNDNTIEIINNYFKKKNIKGELYEDDWVNFGYNRSLALKRSKSLSSYSLVMDADDRLIGNLIIPDTKCTCFSIKLILNNIEYYRKQIFRNDLDWKYKGIIHEYPMYTKKSKLDKEGIIHNCYIRAGCFGNRNNDKLHKYKNDIELLLKGLNNEPNNTRYYFYLANSYRAIRDYKNAIKYYQKRISLNNWDEEIYYSLYSVALCKEKMNLNFEDEIIYDYLRAFNFRNTRLEALYRIVYFFRNKKQYDKAFAYGMLGYLNKYPKDDKLFIDIPIHTYKFKDELSISAYHCGFYKISISLINEIIKNNSKNISKQNLDRIIKNAEFCNQKIKKNQ